MLKSILAKSVSAIISDPPYRLRFGKKDWDNDLPDISIWEECFRVLKPGGYMVPSFYVQASTGAGISLAAVLTTIAIRRSSGVKTRT